MFNISRLRPILQRHIILSITQIETPKLSMQDKEEILSEMAIQTGTKEMILNLKDDVFLRTAYNQFFIDVEDF